jgi:hypothetical protein
MFKCVTTVLTYFIFTSSLCAESPTLRLGAILPLSGDMASWGQNIRRGIDLALAESPNLSITYEDENFCNSAQALT